MQEEKVTVYGVTSKILQKLYAGLEYSEGKAVLSRLRVSAGKTDGIPADVLPVLFENLPEEFLGKGRGLTFQEAAILTALQMYAIHQQGESRNVHQKMEWYCNLGTSLRVLRQSDSAGTDRRFNAMITSDTYGELTTHMRYLVQLLKSKSAVSCVDYAGLARDLLRFQLNDQEQEQIRLNWSREYYKPTTGGKENDEQQ